MFNSRLGLGSQTLWRPNGSWSILSNNYFGTDTLGNPGRKRVHTDNSVERKYFDDAGRFLDKAALSLTADAGCEFGGGVECSHQFFLGFMLYNRMWFDHDRFGMTLGGGAINNPGRYLVLLPPINGATASSGTTYFTLNPGDAFRAWDASV